MKYLIYKIFNAILLQIETVRVATFLRQGKRWEQTAKSFYFDFTDRTTHLGDRLFFLPLIKLLVLSGYAVSFSKNDKITGVFLDRILGITPVLIQSPSINDYILFPAPSYLRLKRKYKNPTIVNFTDHNCPNKITMTLVDSVIKTFNLDVEISEFKSIIKSNSKSHLYQLDPSQKYMLFSNYIDSGRFRKLFLNQKKLIKKADYFKRNGFKIVHLGSIADLNADRRKYDFIDIDLRGKTTISQIIDLVELPCVVGAITYDNFLMHLVGMYGKIAYVLFRGRFAKKNIEHHMLHVNNTFFAQEEKLIYL